MKHFLVICFVLVGLVLFQEKSSASPIDFTTWSSVCWNLGQNSTQDGWDIPSGANSLLTQSGTSGPSAHLNNLMQSNYQIEGSFRVSSTSPFGVIGFVFGYQDAGHFYLFDWRRFNSPLVGKDGIGFAIKKFSAPTLSDLALSDFQSSTSTEYMDVLALHYGPYTRWSPFTRYDFLLEHEPGSFRLCITKAGTLSVLWDVVVYDAEYTYGQFGTYSFYQGGGQYFGFDQQGGTPVSNPSSVPEPATLILLGFGILAIATKMRRGHS